MEMRMIPISRKLFYGNENDTRLQETVYGNDEKDIRLQETFYGNEKDTRLQDAFEGRRGAGEMEAELLPSN